MPGLRMKRSQQVGLGMLITERSLIMVQSQAPLATMKEAMAWHGQPREEGLDTAGSDSEWPDPKWVRQVKRRCGFQAKLLAMAIPEAQLKSFQIQLDADIARSQLKAQLQERLQDLLPWSLADTLWDFQAIQADDGLTAVDPNSRPAWLNQAMQQQPVHNFEIVAMPREWAGQCEHWSKQAGLLLIRLEPAWQASQRWQTYLNNNRAGLLQEPAAVYDIGLSPTEQAVAGGLALGVVQP